MMQLDKSVCVCIRARVCVYDTEGEGKRKRFLCFQKFLIDYLTWHVGSGNLGN